MKKILGCFVLMAIVLVPGPASADLITVGDPYPAGSWAQVFNEAGVGNFDKLEVFMISAGSFEVPGFYGFSRPGWTAAVVNPRYAFATGPDATNMNFTIKFAGTSATPLQFDFLAWDGNLLKEAAHATWASGRWTFPVFTSTADPEDYNRVPVPEPASLTLLGLGLAGVARASRRRKK